MESGRAGVRSKLLESSPSPLGFKSTKRLDSSLHSSCIPEMLKGTLSKLLKCSNTLCYAFSFCFGWGQRDIDREKTETYRERELFIGERKPEHLFQGNSME